MFPSASAVGVTPGSTVSGGIDPTYVTERPSGNQMTLSPRVSLARNSVLTFEPSGFITKTPLSLWGPPTSQLSGTGSGQGGPPVSNVGTIGGVGVRVGTGVPRSGGQVGCGCG